MTQTRIMETAGFVLIAAALHVSAAAIMLPNAVQQGLAANAPAAALMAGSPEVEALVEAWEAEPEAETEIAPPDEMAAPPDAAPDLPEVDVAAAVAAPEPPPALSTPEPVAARPNLPPPPEPQVEIVPPELPELRSFDPPKIEFDPALTLEASARPEQRPRRPEPQQQQVRRTEPQPQQQRRAEPQQDQPRQRQAAAPPPGQGGQSAARSAPGGGGGGVSASQRASLQAQWQQQISSCLMRNIARTSGGSGLRATLSIQIARNGRIQAAQVTGTSGNARVDREIARGAQRSRCPAAPAELTNASYAFTQPISIR